jgi:hypothetical protein
MLGLGNYVSDDGIGDLVTGAPVAPAMATSVTPYRADPSSHGMREMSPGASQRAAAGRAAARAAAAAREAAAREAAAREAAAREAAAREAPAKARAFELFVLLLRDRSTRNVPMERPTPADQALNRVAASLGVSASGATIGTDESYKYDMLRAICQWSTWVLRNSGRSTSRDPSGAGISLADVTLAVDRIGFMLSRGRALFPRDFSVCFGA